MLRKIAIYGVLPALLWVTTAGDARAEVEWSQQQPLKTESPPVDVAITADGKYTFVLTEAGKVLVYSGPGNLEGTIEAGKDVRAIAVSPDGGVLFLVDGKGSAVQVLALDYLQKLNIADSPFKGPAAAPVAVVVFSDFQ